MEPGDLSIDADIRHARTLPSEFYTQPRWFDAVRERVWRRTWHLIGHENELPAPGARKPVVLDELRQLIEKHYRTKHGASDYATLLYEIGRQAVSHLELGQREPGWQTVQLLALALGVDCNEFRDPAIRLPRPAAPRPRGRPARARPPREAAREGSARQGHAEEEKPARRRRRKGG